MSRADDSSRCTRRDSSPRTSSDSSRLEPGVECESCAYCRSPMPARARFGPRPIYCGKRCRQRSSRLHLHAEYMTHAARPGRFAYADPPYPTLAHRYYRHEASYAGEVDHAALVEQLAGGGFMGWALSTSAAALRAVLPLCPEDARLVPWVKPFPIWPRSRGLTNRWEALIVVGGRQTGPGVRDFLRTGADRSGAALMGRKPDEFCAYLFAALGMIPGLDAFEDLFPGTGRVGRAWRDLSARARRDVSRTAIADESSRGAGADESRAAACDMSRVDVVDSSRATSRD